MKYKIEIGGMPVLLNATQVEQLVEIMADSECLMRNWQAGKDAYDIKPVDFDNLSLKPMTQATYDTLKLATKLNAEKSS